jgi:hypothetical protein
MGGHQAIRHDVEDGQEVPPQPPKEEQVVLTLEKDTLPVMASVVEVIIFACAQICVTSWHGDLQTSEVFFDLRGLALQ